MVFSSLTFLFVFLGPVLLLHLILPKAARNLWLLSASLLFYAWGEPKLILVMLISISVNYVIGRGIGQNLGTRRATMWLISGVITNLGLLGYYKYTPFLLETYNWLAFSFGWPQNPPYDIRLPLGISFFTFQAISYLVDVHRGTVQQERSPLNLALYIALFPQLIAGPIVRYKDLADELSDRRITLDAFSEGVQRFIIGLAKKVLIANTLAVPADIIFGTPTAELTLAAAWFGLVCYAGQLFFDFSGYSDMAIGLGRMLGFRFPENFNFPYAARSITDFWRRWHMSLSTWFRDYLYIPLGGNRLGPWRTYRNLLVVFLLCGLWHGGSWTFVLWGAFHGSFLILERVGLGQWLERMPRLVGHVYALTAVLFAWVLFRCETLSQALSFWAVLVGFGSPSAVGLPVAIESGLVIALGAAALLAFPILPWLAEKWQSLGTDPQSEPSTAGVAMVEFSRLAGLAGLMLLASIALFAVTYNPFIYFRF